jgi:uncharacterized protein YkwD
MFGTCALPLVVATLVATPVAEALLHAVDRARAERGTGSLEQRGELDAVAAEHAGELARLPEAERLAGKIAVGDLLERARVPYRHAWIHLQTQRGVRDLPASVVATWTGNAAAVASASDARFDAAGAATADAHDGGTVVVLLVVDDPPVHVALPAMERAIEEAINGERAERGLAPLTGDDTLAALARRHSEDMARRGYFSHVDPDGRSASDRADAAGVGYRRLAENIHSNHGVDDPVAEAVRGWMASPLHRAAILTPGFRLTGVGAARSEKGALYFTQLFLTP